MSGIISSQVDPKRGEIWRVDLNPTVGSEIKKVRPCVVIQRNNWGKLPIRIVVPITGWKPQFDRYPWMIQIVADTRNGLDKASSIDALGVRSVSVERMLSKIGTIQSSFTDDIATAVARCIGCPAVGIEPEDGETSGEIQRTVF